MATRRLLCIPYAGGGTLAFRRWAELLPTHVEPYAVQLPGRENRVREPPLEAWPAMMAALTDAVAPLPPAPTAIFGHSLGAVIGLDLAHWMQRQQPGQPTHLFVSGRPWPGNAAQTTNASLLALPDDDMLQALDRRFGTLATSLAHPEIRELTLPILRADLRLLDSYRHTRATPLDCPLAVFAGDQDPVTPVESLEGWRNETRGDCRVRVFDGSHFFLEEQREQLLADIASCLA